MKKICQQCGKEFFPINERPSRPAKYCSRKCSHKAHTTRVTLICRQCNTSFERKSYMATWSQERGPFCGFQCYGKWQKINLLGVRRNRVNVTCYTCGQSFEKVPSALSKRNFCSRICFGKWRASSEWTGRNNPSWKGGHYDYRGENWGKQSALARKRDNNTCQHCQDINNILHVHHITPFRLFDDYRNANKLDNLITLCNSCHQKADAQFWRNNPSLWEEGKFPRCYCLKTCRKCGKEFEARSGKSIVCDNCCTFICKHCDKQFYVRRLNRHPKYCSRKCRNEHVKSNRKICIDCGGKCHWNAERCRQCDTKWYRAEPTAPRRGRKCHNKPLSISSFST